MEEFIMTQESFDRLWARVQGAPPPQTKPSGEAQLLRFLEETGETQLQERRLAAVFPAMLPLCRETKSRCVRLETQYYLRTGRRAVLPASCCLRQSPLPLLRALCLAARARAAAYAAASADAPDLAALYRDLAGEEQLHADALERLIARLLC